MILSRYGKLITVFHATFLSIFNQNNQCLMLSITAKDVVELI